MTFWQFWVASLRDADQRLVRLTAPAVSDDAPLWDQLERSVVGRVKASVSALFARAASHSGAVAWWRHAHVAWRGLPALVRMRTAGTVALMATAVHLALVWPQRPFGVWWLMVPAMAGTFGLVTGVVSLIGPRTGKAPR